MRILDRVAQAVCEADGTHHAEQIGEAAPRMNAARTAFVDSWIGYTLWRCAACGTSWTEPRV